MFRLCSLEMNVTYSVTICIADLQIQAAAEAAASGAGDLLDTHRGTQRSNVPGSNLVTSRLVDVDVGDDKPGRAPAHLAESPTGSEEVSRVCGCAVGQLSQRTCLCAGP